MSAVEDDVARRTWVVLGIGFVLALLGTPGATGTPSQLLGQFVINLFLFMVLTGAVVGALEWGWRLLKGKRDKLPAAPRLVEPPSAPALSVDSSYRLATETVLWGGLERPDATARLATLESGTEVKLLEVWSDLFVKVEALPGGVVGFVHPLLLTPLREEVIPPVESPEPKLNEPEARPLSDAGVSVSKVAARFCGNCGTPMVVADTFCRACGKEMATHL